MPVIRTRALGAVLAAAIACGGIAACGDDKEPPKGVDLTAIRCPLVPKGDTGQFEPADDAFDTAELVGLELADAEAKAAGHGCNVVVSMEDGKGLPVSTEIDPTRIFVHTEDGAVAEIEGVGGGL